MRSPSKKGQLYGLYAAGTPIRELAREKDIPASSAYSIIKNIERNGTAQITWNTGNEHILSEADEERMIRHVRRCPKQTADQIADYMKVSASTIRRILKAHGYRRLRCRCKPILSDRNVKDRLNWAAANENQDWTQVIFTDEAAFELGDDQAREMCWRQANDEYNPKCLTAKKKRGKQLHVWGAIVHGHKFPLVRFALRPAHQEGGKKIAAETITGKVYDEQILKGPLTEAVAWAKAQGREPLVVEDGAPVHLIKKLAADRARAGIVNVKHPGSSPDLNAIESCWAYVKDRLRRMPGKPSTMDSLWEAIQKAWDEMPQHIVDGFIMSFEKRRSQLLAAHGGHTQF
ncbi:hypothetical protein NCC49_006278 [Naganishia albida]|nr:hypothetical protein NCC49_006278 [Naganishia albida]